MINSLECKVVAVEKKQITMDINGQEVKIAKETIQMKVAPGDILELSFSTPEQAKIKEKELAKTILEEILNGK